MCAGGSAALYKTREPGVFGFYTFLSRLFQDLSIATTAVEDELCESGPQSGRDWEKKQKETEKRATMRAGRQVFLRYSTIIILVLVQWWPPLVRKIATESGGVKTAIRKKEGAPCHFDIGFCTSTYHDTARAVADHIQSLRTRYHWLDSHWVLST